MLCDHTLQGHLGTLCMPGALATSLLCLRGCMRPSVCLAIAWWAGGIHGAGKQGEWSRMEEERMEGGWRRMEGRVVRITVSPGRGCSTAGARMDVRWRRVGGPGARSCEQKKKFVLEYELARKL